jgi:signal-transduction protein with cAMP-binding, CBS, and nucleotidyltransferase domain
MLSRKREKLLFCRIFTAPCSSCSVSRRSTRWKTPTWRFLVEQCQLRFYGSGDSILKPSGGPVEHFYIVKQGRVVGERPDSAETTFEITTGECFPLAALLGERATRTEHKAIDDVPRVK